MPDKPERKPQLKPQKREQILTAAVQSFLDSGYASSRMDAIGDLAGVSYATLYKHFRSKEELFEAAVEYVLGGLYAQWKMHPPPADVREGLTSIAEGFAFVAADARLQSITRAVLAQVKDFPHLSKKLWVDARAPFVARTDAWLAERVREGTLAIDNIERARQQFTSVLADSFFWPRMFMLTEGPSRKKSAELIESAVDLFLARYGTATRTKGRTVK
jgi:TetR/AcrR family transcriptional regulator of autoinduction and epiphytic fitness